MMSVVTIPDLPVSPHWELHPPTVALTLTQPWPWCVCYAGKRVENRGWTPKLKLPFSLAIHAGARPSGARMKDAKDSAEDLRYLGVDVPDNWSPMPSGGPWTPNMGLDYYAWGSIVAVATVRGYYLTSSPPEFTEDGFGDGFWYNGSKGWRLDDVFVLPKPVACRGERGLWPIPSEVIRPAVWKQLRKAAA